MNLSRQTHLDSLRGLAALIVVFVHYLAIFYPYTIFGKQGEYRQHLSLENIIFFPPFGLLAAGHLAVCLFFILSGYVLSYSHLGESQRGHIIIASIIKRPIRLGGLVWFTIICSSLLWHYGLFPSSEVADLTSSKPWFSDCYSGNIVFYNFFIDLTTSSFSKGSFYNPPLWTIKIELYGSLMIYFFALVFGRFRYRLIVCVLLIILFKNKLYQGFWIGLFFADIIKNHTFQNPIRLHKINYFWLLMIFFIYLSSYPSEVTQEFLKGTIYAYLPDDKGFGGGYPMLSAVLIFILILLNNRIKQYLNLPALQFLGHISYGLYTTHFLIMASLSSWLFLFLTNFLSYNLSFIIVLLSGMPIIILAAFLVTKYVDNPSIKLANYIGKKGIDLYMQKWPRKFEQTVK
jgi:peptidoglycan/LPS O-acetylase OafA/YrhL